jgi:hypothetical protein
MVRGPVGCFPPRYMASPPLDDSIGKTDSETETAIEFYIFDQIKVCQCNIKLQFKGTYRRLLVHLQCNQMQRGNCIPLDSIEILNVSSWQKPLNSINFSRLIDDAAETDNGEVAEEAIRSYTDDENNLICNIMNPSTLSEYVRIYTSCHNLLSWDCC